MLADLAHSIPFWLGIYATVLSTTVALVTLYGEIVQRIAVQANEEFLVKHKGRATRMSPSVLEDVEIPKSDARPVLTITVRNRGRREVQILHLQKRYWFRTEAKVFTTDSEGSLPAVVAPGHSHVFYEGSVPANPYEHGSLGRLSRFYAVDGAQRVHPLRERLLQRLENVLYYRPRSWFRKIRGIRQAGNGH